MRLLYTIPDFWPHVRRGSERLVHDLSVVMASRGHEVTVVTRSGPEGPHTATIEGFKVAYAPRPRLSRRALGLNPLEGFAITAFGHGLRHPADVHHSFYISDAYGLSLASRSRHRPLIFSWHGFPDRAWWEEHEPRAHRWYMEMMSRADIITVMADASARQFRSDYGVEPVVLTPGVLINDFAAPRAPGSKRTIVCAAAVDDGRKRIDLLLRAFEIVARELDDVHLLLVGYGDPTEALQLAAAMDGAIATRIDWRPEPDLPSAYSSCIAGALTSYKEAFGLVVIEYLAAGLPALVSNDGGASEILSPGTGVCFPVGDVEGCAAGLKQVLALAEDPETAARCRDRAREYDWTRRADAYEDLYRALT